jgi:ubiquinone/menaquinone biosynthesis C-methylase UbiE
MNQKFSSVTELAGDEISNEQLIRMHHRYSWALPYCKDKSVVELACGTGPGLGMLAKVSKDLVASDYDAEILNLAKEHYEGRVLLEVVDATDMPYPDDSKDIIIIFEAIYYLPNFDKFVDECARVLKPSGSLLIATANKDLYDFNPSPHSFSYYGVVELEQVFKSRGFNCDFFGFLEVEQRSLKQTIFRVIKTAAVALKVMPKTMGGKKILKRIFFGRLVRMPFEISGNEFKYSRPASLTKGAPDDAHKVIYCSARLKTTESAANDK